MKTRKFKKGVQTNSSRVKTFTVTATGKIIIEGKIISSDEEAKQLNCPEAIAALAMKDHLLSLAD